jgi:hypothetical protein
VEQFADLCCMDSHPIVESSSSIKGGYHVSLSSTGGEGSNSSTLNTGSAHTPAASSSIKDDVEIFATTHHIQPDSQELHRLCDDDPERIYEHSKGLLTEVDTERNELLSRIDAEEQQNNLSQTEADALRGSVNESAYYTKIEIKETNNVAVESIDDSSDTEDFMFKEDEDSSSSSSPSSSSS